MRNGPIKETYSYNKLVLIKEVIEVYTDQLTTNLFEKKYTLEGSEITTRIHLSICAEILSNFNQKLATRYEQTRYTYKFEYHQSIILFKALINYLKNKLGNELQQVQLDLVKNNLHNNIINIEGHMAIPQYV